MGVADEVTPLLAQQLNSIPPAPFTTASSGSDERRRGHARFPQTIAHRGYKAEYPENTMGAFRGAVAVGAHALETDLHMSKDGVVVLAHDGNLKRCYGDKGKIRDYDWDYISKLRTLKAPHSPMPRLADLLEYLAQPGLEDIWVLLDIKRDDDMDELLKRTAETIASAPVSKPWNQRIVLGCWTAPYVKACLTHLPGFAISHIGFSVMYARQFLQIPNVSFNMLQKVLVGPGGSRFIRDAKAAGRPIYLWTVNEEEWMEWSIRKDVDGVITDDPKLFLEVCDRWKDKPKNKPSGPFKHPGVRRWVGLYANIALVQVLVTVFLTILFVRSGSPRSQMRKAMAT